MRIAFALMVMVVVVSGGGSVRGAEEPDVVSPAERTARSKAHYDRGRAHFNLGEYEAAMREFEEGYRWKPLPTFLFNIAQSARRAGQAKKALDIYRRYLVLSPKAPDRKSVEQSIAELERELASAPPTPTPPAPTPAAPTPPAPAPPPATPPVIVEPAPTPPAPRVSEPPPPAPATAPAPTSPPPPQPAPVAVVAAPPPPPPVARWRRDWLAPTLVVAGAILLVAGGVDFALNDARRARAGDSYDAYLDARSAATMMSVDAGLMGGGAALVGGAIIRWSVLAAR